MYGLPKNFDGSFLIGRALEMICFQCEHKITGVSGEKDGTLTLVFDDGQILTCYDQLPNYE